MEDLEASGSELYKIFVELGKKYKQDDCFGLCYQKYVLQKCGCLDTYFYPIPNQTLCLSLVDVTCNLKSYLKFYQNDLKQVCGSQCPLECESETFELTLSSSSYPSRGYVNQLAYFSRDSSWSNIFPNISQVSYEQLKDQILSLNVYYGEMKYTTIEELEKTSFLDLVASVGGTLGLFLGMSFMSFCEVFDVLVEGVYLFIDCKMQKRKINPIRVKSKSIVINVEEKESEHKEIENQLNQ